MREVLSENLKTDMIMNKRNLYICPSTQVVLVQLEEMITTSNTKATVDGTDALTPDPTPGHAGGGLSRRKDIWTDPEEENEEYTNRF